MSTTKPRLLSLILACGALSLLACPGCLLPGEGSSELTFHPEGRQLEYVHSFDQAFAAPSADGGYDLVMTSGYALVSPREKTRVYPASFPPVSQVLHVHVAWRPARGSKSDFPAATNSSVHWRLYRGQLAQASESAVYEGVGHVSVEVDKHHTLFDLRDVLIEPEHVDATMRDPLGRSRVSGAVRAENNAEAVAAILRDLQAATPGEPRPAATR